MSKEVELTNDFEALERYATRRREGGKHIFPAFGLRFGGAVGDVKVKKTPLLCCIKGCVAVFFKTTNVFELLEVGRDKKE